MGERAISPMGHVRMMAAVQPFISGAISKTVNMPETATVEDVENIYFQGWKLGLKALAIYRDNCKVGQPLSGGKGKNDGTKEAAPVEAAAPAALSHPVRKRLPKKRTSVTTSFTVAGAEGYMTAGMYPDDSLGEVFLKLGKQGSTLAGVMDAFSIAISIALQYGVPLETYVSKFTNMRFEPAGMTDDPDIRIAQSVMDYIFRRLALDYLPVETRAELGIFTAEERAAQVSGYGTSASTADVVEEEDVDLEELRSSAPIETAKVEEKVTPRGPEVGQGGALLGRAARAGHRHGHRRAAVHDLRHEDAAGRQLLRLRGLRLHQRLQLSLSEQHRPAPRSRIRGAGAPVVGAMGVRSTFTRGETALPGTGDRHR